MAHHENHDHGHDHDHDHTEGNRQYYPQGWWIPVVGLVVIGLGFGLLGYNLFNIAGTDKWGKGHETAEMHGGHGHEAEGHKDAHNDHQEAKHEETPAAPAHDSTAPAADSSKADTAAKHEDHH
ncbi:MAG: hypothetical protein Fur0041_19000 [Bacteroidia bacterium]